MSAISCKTLDAAMASLVACAHTDEGTRFTTQCLYPSFDPVQVYVVGFGEGYKVHDGGGAVRVAWDHGRDHSLVRRMLKEQATAYRIEIVEDALVAEAVTHEWLVPAILAVANASAASAHAVVERTAISQEDTLRDRILAVLKETVSPTHIATHFAIRGRSGKEHEFDFALRRDGASSWLIIDAVSPHHVSIASKYVAFSDTRGEDETLSGRFAVFDKPLVKEDASLLQQVADLVPFKALRGGVARELAS